MGSMVFGGIIFLALCFAFVCARIYAAGLPETYSAHKIFLQKNY